MIVAIINKLQHQSVHLVDKNLDLSLAGSIISTLSVSQAWFLQFSSPPTSVIHLGPQC